VRASGLPWRIEPTLVGGHLPDDEPPLGDLLAYVLELLFALFLLAELLWTWHFDCS
jgi:hypothetical protein